MNPVTARRQILILIYAWFPNHQSLFDRIQQMCPSYEIRYLVLSPSDNNRAWGYTPSQLVKPTVVPGFQLYLGSYTTININPSLSGYLSRLKPDLMIIKGWPDPGCITARRFAKRNSIPLITWLCARDPRAKDSIAWRMLRSAVNIAVARQFIRDSRFIFVYGTQAKEDTLALGASPEQIIIVKMSISESHFDCEHHRLGNDERLAMRRNLGLHDGPLFLCVSQLVPRKGIQDLLEAFSLVRKTHAEAQLLLIGNGVLKDIVQARARDSGGVFAWLPAIPYPEIPKYYLLSDCFVFPTHFDAWGTVINESHCSKLPVITSDGAFAARDLIVHGQSGLVFRAGDVAGLAEAMGYALDHPSEMRRMAECGHLFVKTQWNEQETARLWARHIELAL